MSGASIEREIRARLDAGRYALVGAGQLGEMSIDQWPAGVPLPRFFLDSFRRGQCRGIDVHPLQEHRADPSLTYLLSAFKMSAADARGIFGRLGQPRVLTVYDLFEHYSPRRFSNGWRRLDPDAATLAALERVRACLADDTSRRVLDATLAWRYRRELVDDCPVEPEDDKYGLAKYGRGGRHYDLVYDGGAYDLSLAGKLLDAGASFARYVAFEPDPASLARCASLAPAMAQRTGVAPVLEPLALSDHAGEERFLANGLMSARLVDGTGDSTADAVRVRTDRLDRYHREHFAHEKVSDVLVKLHVEGAEPAALRGASGLIGTCVPDLFVNLSHDEASLLEVPPMLADTGRYAVHLRAHSLFGEGVTLFACARPAAA